MGRPWKRKEAVALKKFPKIAEAIFDVCYLVAALVIGILLLKEEKTTAGIMTVVLAFGDAFHLIPRILTLRCSRKEKLCPALGRGKQITSITMTIFYLFLWQLGSEVTGTMPGAFWQIAIYILAAVRIFLCLMPQNKWTKTEPPVSWGIVRNIPFTLLGLMVAVRFFLLRSVLGQMQWMWLAILLSFLCYLPVVLWADRNRKLGMLMLPKTCMYLWMIMMF